MAYVCNAFPKKIFLSESIVLNEALVCNAQKKFFSPSPLSLHTYSAHILTSSQLALENHRRSHCPIVRICDADFPVVSKAHNLGVVGLVAVLGAGVEDFAAHGFDGLCGHGPCLFKRAMRLHLNALVLRECHDVNIRRLHDVLCLKIR